MDNSVGKLSVSSENIFPIIKDKLYDNQDAFVRELVSNCADAITKRRLVSDEAGDWKPRIDVTLDRDTNTIIFADNGVGMSRSEIDAYINNIAFSGAVSFVKELDQKDDTGEEQLIGQFGLGFYSAFMVSDLVEIQSCSFLPGTKPVHWRCSGSTMEFSMEPGEKQGTGTEVILHVAPDSPYLNGGFMQKILTKYCGFCPFDLYLTVILRDDECKEGTDKVSAPLKVNETTPIWTRRPEELTDEDYIEFYHRYFEDYYEPVFWLNLYNEDLGVRGILYCRRIDANASSLKGEVRLYSRQVFVSNNQKGIIPEFLMLQNGIVDIQQLPLNVSRSSLREDGYAAAIQQHLARQAGGMLCRLFQSDRALYERIWPELDPFVKLGLLQDKTFRHEIKECILYQNIDGQLMTLEEFLERSRATCGEVVYYVSDEIQQAQYVSIFKKCSIPAVMMTNVVDSPFVQMEELERKNTVQFKRIDADLNALLDTEGADTDALEEAQKLLWKCYAGILAEGGIKLQAACLRTDEIPALIVLDEQIRRVQEAAELYNLNTGSGEFVLDLPKQTFILNIRSALVQQILARPEHPFSKLIAMQLLDLAQLSQETLEANDMVDFIDRSNFIMEKLLERVNAVRKDKVEPNE